MNDMLTSILFLAVMIYVINRNKSILKKLTKLQILGAAVSFFVTLLIAFMIIYFIGNSLSGYFENKILKVTSELFLVIITLSLCGKGLRILLQKITKGALTK
ncbi:hypothetical protein SAMN05443252_102101 [Bacillus sp. OV322]|uniref:hypothetical protein n=1 Tax=Bacillus sp. OV322 TaxID=1882764 RepID=UPI0008F04412|nr:hypothetical protein [Bacillus sp. OV322]SFC18693.1 hypothetical protein SAMN05443252_102101 [Bacillus sp. OV322]